MDEFKPYACKREVLAMPLTKGEGVKAQVVLFCEPEEESLPGYLVQNDDGREIWISKEEFESKFRPVGDKEEKAKVNINIKTIEIAGLASALYALRLPFGKDCRSMSQASFNWDGESGMTTNTMVDVDPKDKQLLSTLIKRGDEHAKAIRGLIVYAEINAPRYLWVELDTYKIGAERLSSESTMHIQGKGLSTEELVEMKEHLEEGTMQKRVEYFSYQTLRRIYFQRRNHRLPHWHKFCDWIETLPFATEWITVQNNLK